MTFLPPPRQRTGPYTECGACGAWKKDHGPKGECPPSRPMPQLDEKEPA